MNKDEWKAFVRGIRPVVNSHRVGATLRPIKNIPKPSKKPRCPVCGEVTGQCKNEAKTEGQKKL